MVLGSHAKTRAMYSTPPWPSLAASAAAYRRRSFSDNHPKKRCIFSSISAEYPSMLYSLSQNLLWRKDTPAQACREVILDHILRGISKFWRRLARSLQALHTGRQDDRRQPTQGVGTADQRLGPAAAQAQDPKGHPWRYARQRLRRIPSAG